MRKIDFVLIQIFLAFCGGLLFSCADDRPPGPDIADQGDIIGEVKDVGKGDIPSDIIEFVPTCTGDETVPKAADLPSQLGAFKEPSPDFEVGCNGIIWAGVPSYDSLDMADIFFYRFSDGTTTRITTDNLVQSHPTLSLDYLAWREQAVGDGKGQIQLYRIETAERTEISPFDADKVWPVLSNEFLIWADWRPAQEPDPRSDIMLYDLQNKNLKQLTKTAGEHNFPAIGNHYGAWVDFSEDGDKRYTQDGNDTSHIYAYEILTGAVKKLTEETVLRLFPVTDGYRIVWTEVMAPTGDTLGKYRIVVYNMLTGAREKEFNEIPSPDRIPRASISNQFVAYVYIPSPNQHDINLYNLQTETGVIITSDPSPDIAYLKVFGTLIVSMEKRNADPGWTLRFHDIQP